MDDAVSGEIYNVGSTNRISIKALADRVIEMTGSSSNDGGHPVHRGLRARDRRHVAPHPFDAKINAALGWEPERSLEDILGDVIAFERGRVANPV